MSPFVSLRHPAEPFFWLRFSAVISLFVGWAALFKSFAKFSGSGRNAVEFALKVKVLEWTLSPPFLLLLLGVIILRPSGQSVKFRLFWALLYGLAAIYVAWFCYPDSPGGGNGEMALAPGLRELILFVSVVFLGWIGMPLWWMLWILDRLDGQPSIAHAVPTSWSGAETRIRDNKYASVSLRVFVSSVVLVGGVALTAAYHVRTSADGARTFESHLHPDLLPRDLELGLPFALLVLGIAASPRGPCEFTRLFWAYTLGVIAAIVAVKQTLLGAVEGFQLFGFFFLRLVEADDLTRSTVAFGVLNWVTWISLPFWGLLWKLDDLNGRQGHESPLKPLAASAPGNES